MTEPRRSPSLKELGDRLAQARSQQDQGGDGGSGAGVSRSSLGWAFRIGVDLVSALIVGVGIGWFLDRTFETMPLFLVLFFFLGAAAGALNVWRLVSRMGMVSGKSPAAPSAEAGSGSGDDRGSAGRD
ncbi:hypothetical protein STHU_51920 [Allostella humosa]|uniref:AtpZ/AtpI family protein n=1 Tax=Stella humosa TaxID=94 RepID=UPI000F4B2269|nr:AtpZ/AtpI family protein [Stella humosa]BBK34558.1 hypothetical protein STHU_51920 [Stella humosa]